ncbi:hypothetical protein [Paenibacillus planticolens]|nr:hypothetical protein [Paenibacillus planticolens]
MTDSLPESRTNVMKDPLNFILNFIGISRFTAGSAKVVRVSPGEL